MSNSDGLPGEFDSAKMFHTLKLHYCFRQQNTIRRPSDKTCCHPRFAPVGQSVTSAVDTTEVTTARVAAIRGSRLYLFGYTGATNCLCWRDLDSG